MLCSAVSARYDYVCVRSQLKRLTNEQLKDKFRNIEERRARENNAF